MRREYGKHFWQDFAFLLIFALLAVEVRIPAFVRGESSETMAASGLYDGNRITFTLRGCFDGCITSVFDQPGLLCEETATPSAAELEATTSAAAAPEASPSEANSQDASPSDMEEPDEIPLCYDLDGTLILGDDTVVVFLNDGSVRRLEDDEYSVDYVTIPADRDGYEYEVYGACSQNTAPEDYVLIGNGSTRTEQTIQMPKGICAVFVRWNQVTGSYTGCVQVGIRLHLDREAQQKLDVAHRPDHDGKLVNFSYLRVLHGKAGRERSDGVVDMDAYEGVYGTELAARDREIYGAYLYRDAAEVRLSNPVITIAKQINEAYEAFGTPTFLYRIVSDTGETSYRMLAMDAGQLSGSIAVAAEYGHVYRITELPVSRYRLTQVQPGANAVLTADGKGVNVDLTQENQADVVFIGEMTQYEKFSHTFR